MRSILLCWFALTSNSVAAVEPLPAGHKPSTPPAEELRLSPAIFREGLRQRGLTVLLEEHLREYPPLSPSAAILMQREVKLAEFADHNRSLAERRAAIAEANQLLAQLIRENSTDSRSLEWRLILAHSLVYDEGEAYSINLLYFGGTTEDRKKLAPLAERALATVNGLLAQIEEENERIDAMDAATFDRVDQEGLVEKLDRLKPSAQYLQLWAYFYDALHRDSTDAVRSQRLEQIMRTLGENTEWLTTPHSVSQVQIPASLLAGMAQRRLGNQASAREHFDRLFAAFEKIVDEAEKRSLQWALVLGRLEAARNARDEGRFQDAEGHLGRLRNAPGSKGPEQFGVRLAAALVDQSILLARARSADSAGRATDAAGLREKAWQAMATLAREEPEHRTLLYTVLYESAAQSGGPTAGHRDPVETCAMLAGLLADAEADPSRKETLLRQLIDEGSAFLRVASGAQRSVVPEVLYHMGVAHFRLGESVAAVERFLEVARLHPTSGQAADAAAMAVQIAAQACQEPRSCPSSSSEAKLLRTALETLLSGFPETESGKYWRFFFAQLLEESGDYKRAAAQYALVQPEQELYVEAAFRQLRALVREGMRQVAQGAPAKAELAPLIESIIEAQRILLARAKDAPQSEGSDQAPSAAIRVQESWILVAETYLLKGVDEPARALQVLAEFDQSPGPKQELMGRAWRVRLRALEALGRLNEATRMVPDYIAADPLGAGPTLQTLYLSLVRELNPPTEGQAGIAESDANMLVLIASEIVNWTNAEQANATAVQKQEAAVQLAETYLLVGQPKEAIERFEPNLPDNNREPATLSTLELRTLLGYAQALLDDGQAERALPAFNRLATNLPPEHPVRWKALIGDLESRTKLKHPPEGILQVVAQQRRLFPELGGPEIAARLEQIYSQNTHLLEKKDRP